MILHIKQGMSAYKIVRGIISAGFIKHQKLHLQWRPVLQIMHGLWRKYLLIVDKDKYLQELLKTT